MTNRRYAADVYNKTVKLTVNKCEEDTFIWCPAYIENIKKETVVAASKVLRFNKGGMMIREV